MPCMLDFFSKRKQLNEGTIFQIVYRSINSLILWSLRLILRKISLDIGKEFFGLF
jgi:hypothetical protein